MHHRDTESTEVELDRITEQIIGAAIEVHKVLGPGLLESAYEECLCHELSLRDIPFERQKPLAVEYKGCKLDCGYRLAGCGGGGRRNQSVQSNRTHTRGTITHLSETWQVENRAAHQLQRPCSERGHLQEDSMTSLCPLCLCGEMRLPGGA